MRRRLVVIGCVMLMSTSWAVMPGASAAPPGFVTRSGTHLSVDGKPFRFTGFNIYNANSDGWCWYGYSDQELFDTFWEMNPPDGLGSRAHEAVRAWFFQPLATVDGERDWTRFDRTLATADQYGMKVVVTLTDQWGECGSKVASGYKDRTWYETGYTQVEAGNTVSYRDWVAEVVGRYADDPRVAFWQLINEAEVSEVVGGVQQPCPPGDEPADILKSWADDVSSLIRSIDPNHLISLGTIGNGQCGAQGAQYRYVHDLPNIDLCEYHDYGSPAVGIPGDQFNGLQVRIDQCSALDKPIFVGEAGIKPSEVGGTLQDRADAFEAKLEAQFDAGVAGFLAWNWSRLGSELDNYDVGPGDPAIEALSGPLLNALIVDSTADTPDADPGDWLCADALGRCTLRAAIEEGNTDVFLGGSQVVFEVEGDPIPTISPTSQLPTVTGNVTIFGGSLDELLAWYRGEGEPSPPIGFTLQGSQAPGAWGLHLTEPAGWVSGVAIHGFDAGGLLLERDAQVYGSYVGLGSDGAPSPSDPMPVGVSCPSRCFVSHSVVSGNDVGISLTGGSGSRVMNSIVGLDAGGTVPIPNGVGIMAGPLTAGGGYRFQFNTISGNEGDGLVVSSVGRPEIRDNWIGTSSDGSTALGNGGNGITLSTTPNAGLVEALVYQNRISGNGGHGIWMSGPAGSGGTLRNALVSRNEIGIGADGSAMGNGGDGLRVEGPMVRDSSLTLNTVAHNDVGIRVLDGSASFPSVAVVPGPTFDNAGIGIDLDGDGVTLNDPGDLDEGTNDLLNYPVITSVVEDAGSITIEGSVDLEPLPEQHASVELYRSDECDPSGYGEGEERLGTAFVALDENGDGDFALTTAGALGSDDYFTAVTRGGLDVTDNGIASEFSACFDPSAPPDPDADADGIWDAIEDPGVVGGFLDASTDPDTFGQVVSVPADLSVVVEDDPTDGVRVQVSGPGTDKVTLSICGLTVKLASGSDAVFTCGSLIAQVVAGQAEIVLGDGLATIVIPDGVSAEVDEGPAGTFTVGNVSGDGEVIVTVDGTVTTVGEGDPPLEAAAWDFTGFFAPVDMPPTENVAKAGSSIPFTWRVVDAAGAPVHLESVEVHVASRLCDPGGPDDPIEVYTSGSSGLQDLGDGYYRFTWKTKKDYRRSCRALTLSIGDGVDHRALFRFT